MWGAAPMSDLWLRLALACPVIIGIWTMCLPDMILGRLTDAAEHHWPKWVCKPLFLCCPCMASLHGTWIWFLTGGHWTGLAIFLLALCGLLKLIAHNLLRNG